MTLGKILHLHSASLRIGVLGVQKSGLNGRRSFKKPRFLMRANKKHDQVEIHRFLYTNLRSDARYVARKQAEKISYLWDELIKIFTTHMIDGTSITPDGYEFDLKQSELGVRYMALEPRFGRRSHGEALKGVLEIGMTKNRFFRTIIGSADAKENETAFFIHTFKYLNWMEQKGGYKKYRIKRAECTQVYARGILESYPHLKRVVGIALEPPCQGRGASEDLVYAEQYDWTDEDRRVIKQACKEYGVLQGRMKKTPVHLSEWPAPMKKT